MSDLPDKYAIVAMRYKDAELAFCIRPNASDDELIGSVRALREKVNELADAPHLAREYRLRCSDG